MEELGRLKPKPKPKKQKPEARCQHGRRKPQHRDYGTGNCVAHGIAWAPEGQVRAPKNTAMVS
jgi:hypothetical protein